MRASTGVLPDPAPKGRRARAVLAYEAFEASSRDPDVLYRVTCDADGSWDCTCPAVDYRARLDGRCRHIDKHIELAARPVLVIPGFL